MSASPVARRVELTAWSTLSLGVVCLLLAALEVAVPVLLRRLGELPPGTDEPALAAAREAFVSSAGSSAAINGAFGVILLAIGAGIARRAHWAHPAMTAAAWASIVAVLAIAKPSLAPFAAMTGGGVAAGALVWGGGLVLLAAQIVGVLVFLRFWRGEAVRNLFG